MMKLTAIGTSGSYPGPHAAASCYLLQIEAERTWNIVLDLGSGALGPLQRWINHTDIDAVVLSHLHPDHCLDVTGLYVMHRYDPRFLDAGGPPNRLAVYGPASTRERLTAAHHTDPGASPVPADSTSDGLEQAFEFTDMRDGQPFTVGPVTITPHLVHHPVEAYAVRIEYNGAVLAYSGDSDACENLTTAAREADLFLCEAAFEDGRDTVRGIHLNGERAGRTAQEAGTKRLVLTHIAPWTNSDTVTAAAARHYSGTIDLAVPDRTWEIRAQQP